MKILPFREYAREKMRHPIALFTLAFYGDFCLFSTVWFLVKLDPSRIFLSLIYLSFLPLFLAFEWISHRLCNEIFTFLLVFTGIGTMLGVLFRLYVTVAFLEILFSILFGALISVLFFHAARVFFDEDGSCRRKFLGTVLFSLSMSTLAFVVLEALATGFSLLTAFDFATSYTPLEKIVAGTIGALVFVTALTVRFFHKRKTQV